MASTSAVTIAALPSPCTVITKRPLPPLSNSASLFTPLKASIRAPAARLEIRASAAENNDRAAAALTAGALAAALLVPEIAEAAQPGISPSLKNFLLSIVSGGVVLAAITGAVVGVSNFDPVKRA